VATDAMGLLRSLPGSPLDAQVRDRIVAESHGNPLALLEWRRALTPAEGAGRSGSALAGGGPLTERLEGTFRRRLAELPSATQRFASRSSTRSPIAGRTAGALRKPSMW
jgi:hypothetical protein